MTDTERRARDIADKIIADMVEDGPAFDLADVDDRSWLYESIRQRTEQALLAERQAALAEQRYFPMQDGPKIPWSLAETIYKVYKDLFGNDQSLERLAERGGFGWSEVSIFYERHRKRFGRQAEKEG